MTLYAFDFEIMAIADRVNEPLAGEIRVQWWRDAFSAQGDDQQSGNPVADAMLGLIKRGRIQPEKVQAYLDAQRYLFQDDGVEDEAALERHFEATHGAVFCMAWGFFEGAEVDPGDNIIAAMSAATGYVKLLSEFGKNASRGRIQVASDMLENHNLEPSIILRGEVSENIILMLDEVRETARVQLAKSALLVRQMERRLFPSLAHLAVLRSVLKAMEKNRKFPFSPPPDTNPLMSQWRIWRAVQSGKI